MRAINVPASITIENGIAIQKYKWKSENKISILRENVKEHLLRLRELIL